MSVKTKGTVLAIAIAAALTLLKADGEPLIKIVGISIEKAAAYILPNSRPDVKVSTRNGGRYEAQQSMPDNGSRATWSAPPQAKRVPLDETQAYDLSHGLVGQSVIPDKTKSAPPHLQVDGLNGLKVR